MIARTTDEEIRLRLQRRVYQVGDPSYRDMEKKLGIAHQRIQSYVTGTTQSLPAIFLARFCVAYPTDLVWMMTGIGTPEVSGSVPAAEQALGEIEGILRRYHQQVAGA